MFKPLLRQFERYLFLVLTLFLLSGYGTLSGSPREKKTSLDKIETIVVIYAENRSFDNLYGLFPGANGIIDLDEKAFIQRERDGLTPLQKLPSVWNAAGSPVMDKLNFISELPNKPFRIEGAPSSLSGGLLPKQATPDLAHRFYQNQMQINGGKNDQFAAWSDAGGLAMGYYDGSVMRMWKLAEHYTLADNFFMAAFGGSFLNHFWLISASTPRYPDAPDNLKSSVEESGLRLKTAENSPVTALSGKPIFVADKPLTPDGYAVNTMQPPYQPSGIAPAEGGEGQLADKAKNPLPPQNFKTIGDALSEKGILWRWYAGAWNEALRNRAVINNSATANFQPHHQPFNYFKRFDPSTKAGSRERKIHLKDYSDLQKDIDSGTLPSVVFYKPEGKLNQHPGYTDVMSGDMHIADVVEKLQKSPQWKKMVIIVTYDENGGYWDHVAPPKGDRWGPGTRVPTIIISPFAKTHFIDHTIYDTTSILKLITNRFHLDPLQGIRYQVGDLSNAFN